MEEEVVDKMPEPEPQLFVDDMEGTLLSVKDNGASSEFIIWFPFSKKAMKMLRNGVLLTAKNYSGTDAEERLSIMQITKAIPSHYALGIAGSEKLDAYPGYMDAAYISVFNDLDKDKGDESTKILCHASPTHLEVQKPSSITSANTPTTKIVDDTSIPMLGSAVNIITPEWTERIFNRDLQSLPRTIEVGQLSGLENVKILALWEELIRTHFGIFAYTNAGKSNLISTCISKIFATPYDPKIIVYDLQSEYGGLLIDTLCNTEDACIVFTDRNTVDQSVYDYWVTQNNTTLDAAADTLARTTILPKALLQHRQNFVAPFRQLLQDRKVRLVGADTADRLGTIIGNASEELINKVVGTDKRVFKTFIDGLVDAHRTTMLTEEHLGALRTVVEAHEADIGGSREQHKTYKSSVLGLKDIIDGQLAALAGGQQLNTDFLISRNQILESLNTRNTKSLFVIQGEENQVRFFSNTIGGNAMESRRRSGNIEPVAAFIYDEADQFIPQDDGGRGASVPAAKERAVELARRGRKYGLGIGIGTQRIVYLDTNVLGQPHTYFVSKLPRESDRDKIQAAFGLAKEVLEETHRFRKGEWLLISHSATGLDGTPIPVILPNANDRIEGFVTNFTPATT